MDRERSRLTLCLANMQLPADGPEHALKLVDDSAGRTMQQPPSSLGQETAATAFGSAMEEEVGSGRRDGERLLAASSLLAAVPNMFSHLISLEDSCRTKHSSSHSHGPSR